MQLLLGHVDDVCDEILKAFEVADHLKTGSLNKKAYDVFIAQLQGKNVTSFSRSNTASTSRNGFATDHLQVSAKSSAQVQCKYQQPAANNVLVFPVFFHAYCPVRFESSAENLFLAFKQRLLVTSFEEIDQPSEGYISMDKIINVFNQFASVERV